MQEETIHVCLLMRQFWPTLAGAAERMRRYAPGLALRGMRMHVICFWREGLPRTERLEDGTEITRVERTGSPQEADISLFMQADVCLSGLPAKRRVLQTNLLGSHTVKHIRRISNQGIPVVYLGTMNEVDSAKVGVLRRWLRAWRLRQLFRPFAAAVVGSESMQQWLVEAGVSTSRVHQIGHGVDLSRFRPATDGAEKRALRQSLNLPEATWVVLFVGTMTERKGAHLLAEAWSRMHKSGTKGVLVMLGAFDRPTVVKTEQCEELVLFQENLRRLMDPLIFCEALIHHEHTPDIELWMRASDLLVLPSSKEGVPNVVLEGMSSGLPCLLTRFQGFPEDELGQDGVHYQIIERSTAGLEQALLQFQEDDSQQTRIGSNALARAREHFDLNLTLDRYAALYRDLVRRG